VGLDSIGEVGCSVPVRGLRGFLGTGDRVTCLGDANGETLALFFLFRAHLYTYYYSRCELPSASVFTHCSQELSPTVLTLELWSFLAHVSIGKDGLAVESISCVWSDSICSAAALVVELEAAVCEWINRDGSG
jgi:hypothetical protein